MLSSSITPTTSTNSSRLSSSLPPEILREIFCYLIPFDPANDLQLDLLACSLVCQPWQFVAIDLIHKWVFRSTLEFPEYCSRIDISRFGDLILEAHRLKTTIFDCICGLQLEIWDMFVSNDVGTIDVSWFSIGARNDYLFREGEATMIKIFEALADNLTELTLDFGLWVTLDNEQFDRFSSIFARSAPYCYRVSRLTLKGIPSTLRTRYPVISFIDALRNTLRIVELRDMSHHEDLALAIKRCQHVSKVRIKSTSINDLIYLINLTRSWRHLESFHLNLDEDIYF